MIKLLILLAGMYSVNTVSSNPIVEKVKDYNQSLLEIGRPAGKQVFVYDYVTEFEYWDDEMPAQKVQTKMYIGETDVHYFSNLFDVFMDQNYVVTIMKEQKQVVITRAMQNYDPTYTIAQMAAAQNYMLDSAKVTGQQVLENGLVELKLDTRNLGLANFYVENILYQCNPKTGEIKKSVTTYSDEYELKRMTYTMREINLNGSYQGFKPVEKMIFKPNYTLVDQYKGYELIVD